MKNEPPAAEALIQALPTAVLYTENDAHYTLRFANEQAARMLGYSIEDFLGNDKYTAASAVHPDDLDLLEEADEMMARGDRVLITRYRLIDTTGDQVPVLDISRPDRRDDGTVRGFITTLVDLRGAPALQGPSGILNRAT